MLEGLFTFTKNILIDRYTKRLACFHISEQDLCTCVYICVQCVLSRHVCTVWSGARLGGNTETAIQCIGLRKSTVRSTGGTDGCCDRRWGCQAACRSRWGHHYVEVVFSTSIHLYISPLRMYLSQPPSSLLQKRIYRIDLE